MDLLGFRGNRCWRILWW